MAAARIVIGAYGKGVNPVVTGLVPLTWVSAGTDLWNSKEVLQVSSLNMVPVNGVPTNMGRWPNLDNKNGGYNTIRSSTSKTVTDQIGLTTAPSAGKPTYFVGAEIVVRTQRWALDRHPILSYNSGSSTITFDPSSTNEIPNNGLGYFIQDNSSVLDRQNEWWYNRASKTVKMYSKGAPANVSAANLQNLLVSLSKSYVTIDNITFNGCNADAISIESGSRITIQNCIIQNAGRNGVKATSPYFSFLNNKITNVMSKGILVNPEANHTTIKYNAFRNVGQIAGLGTSQKEDSRATFSGDGVYVKGHAVKIEHNTFVNMGYSAVHLTKVDSAIIKYNFIDTVCNVLDDGGAIYSYTGTAYTNYGRQISHNIILHGIGAFYGSGVHGGSAAGAGVAGIYNDRGTSDIIEDSNTVAYFEKGIFMNYGCNRLKITNNTFYNNINGIQINTRLNDRTRTLAISGNISIALTKLQKSMYIYSNDGDVLNLMGTIDNNYYTRPIDDNITMCWQTSPGSSNTHNTTLANWQIKYTGYDAHSKKGPQSITDTSQIRFEFNGTHAAKTISLADNYVDARGKIYSASMVLQPFKSAVLIKTTAGAPNTPPTVSLTTPIAGASFTAPASINLTAIAADANGSIVKVEFYNGTTLIGTDYSSPYSFTWSGVTPGNYVLTAKATDNAGSTGSSSAVTVSVIQPPIANGITITSPLANASYISAASINVSAAAIVTGSSIVKVEFFIGTTLLKTEQSFPYAFTWNNVQAGNYALTAKATDNRGLVTTSAVVAITVSKPNIAPAVRLTSPSVNAVFAPTASINITAAATDADGSIAKVEFYNGTTLLTTEFKYPYSWNWQNVATGNYTITAVATDNAGLTTTSQKVYISVTADPATSTNMSRGSVSVTDDVARQNKPGTEMVAITIGPNPASNLLKVFTHNFARDEKMEISILSMSGTLVKTIVSNTSNQVIPVNITSFVSGLYTIKIKTGDTLISTKFVKL